MSDWIRRELDAITESVKNIDDNDDAVAAEIALRKYLREIGIMSDSEIQNELNIRKREYILKEIDALKRDLESIDGGYGDKMRSVMGDSPMQNNVPIGNTSDLEEKLDKQFRMEEGRLIPKSDCKRMSNCRRNILLMLGEVLTDTMQVFDFGAEKHPDSGDTPNFLMPEGNKCSLKDRGSSVLRHAARTFMDPFMKDEESGLYELLHLLASVSIIYIRMKRGIIHPDDLTPSDVFGD